MITTGILRYGSHVNSFHIKCDLFQPDTSGSLAWNMRMLTAESENKRLKAELEKMRSIANVKNAHNRKLKAELANLRKAGAQNPDNGKRYVVVNVIPTNK